MLLYVSIFLDLSPLLTPAPIMIATLPQFTADAEYYRFLKDAIARPVKWWR